MAESHSEGYCWENNFQVNKLLLYYVERIQLLRIFFFKYHNERYLQ